MTYLLPDRAYDLIKYAVTVVMPACSVAYVGLAGIWGWPWADEVSRTVAVAYTFLCALMGISGATARPAPPDPDATAELPRHLGGE